MPGIARVSSDTAGGTQLGGGQDFCRIDGDLIVLLGDDVAGHGPGAHAAPVMAEGSPFARINGIPICRAGHLASCGDASTGSNYASLSD